MNYNNYERYKDAKFFKFSEEYPVIMKTYPDWKEINPILEKYQIDFNDNIIVNFIYF